MATVKTTQATKAGEWVLPILVDGKTIYAIQLNKTQEDKDNIDNILAEYSKQGIPVYEYEGKNNKPVLLVEHSKRIKTTRIGKNKKAQLDAMLSMGLSEEQALAVLATKA